MTGINWIHLSDWHQRGNDFDRRVIKEKLLEDIERRATINPNLENIDFVVFSGDLTYNGRKEEFETIKKELLDPLLKACGDLDPSRLFIVPGNHDLNRDDFELLPSALLHHLTDADAKCWLNDERKRAEVLKPFYEFANFISAYTKQKNAIFGSVCELNLDGNRIALIGLNSALMCGRKDQNGDDDDERNILVGELQIQDIFNRISGSDIKIAVLHHPFDWLARFDRRYVEERLTNECDFILNGHQHHPVVKQISKTVPGYYVHISTGAAYDNRIPKDPLYINAYNLVHLDLTAKQGVVFLRHWNNSLTEWTEDRDSLPDAKFQFSLAKLISNSLLSTSEQHGIAVSLEAESDLESFQIQGPPIEQRNYMDSLTFVRDLDHRTLDEFRIQIREEIRERYPDNLSNVEFLTGSNLMVDGHLTRSGVLLFGKNPQEVCRSAITQCSIYRGKDKTAPFERMQFVSTIPNQIIDGRNFIASRVMKSESPVVDRAQLEAKYEYPMICVREIIANALAHRDYESNHRFVHIYLYSDRIEIMSPGNWFDKTLIDGKSYQISELISPSIKRNIALSDTLSWIRLVEIEGRGIPYAIRDCKENNAPMPEVIQKDGFVTVTIWPSRDFKKMIAAAYIIPNQIPPPLDFKGREEEIKSLLDQFDHGVTITGLRGLGGIGKTALALVVSNQLRDRFPDGQIFLDMQGTSMSPLRPEDAMAHIIRSYRGADASLPVDLNSLSGLYHSVLSGKRALILLDNAANREQVEQLLPPAGSALLITTRNKFALPGLKETDLDVLPLEDAKKLLLEIAVRIGDHAEELAKLCGDLPLALRNAAYALAEKKNLGVADYVERLKDSRKRLELVDASFTLSYELLTPELQRLWCMLSVFPADFDLDGASAVWEMEKEPSEDALSELGKWSLVDFLPSATGEGGRYRLHDLARFFADSRLEADARELAQQRHAMHYQELLWKANELFLQGGDSLSVGLLKFDNDWTNIQIGQKWAKANTAKSNEVAEICSNFARAGSILNLRLHPLRNIEWLEEALVAVRKTTNENIEGIHLGNLGQAYSDLGETRKAIEYYGHAIKISREIGDRRGEGKQLGSLGNAYSYLGETRKAIEYCEQALMISREIGDRRGEGGALCNLGVSYSDLGKTRKAIEYYEQALKILREIGDRRGEGAQLGNLGLSYSNLGEPLKAIEYSEQALKISREIDDRRSEGVQLGSLGNAYTHLGEPLKAIEYYEQALMISREIGDRRGEGNRLFNMSLSLDRLGQREKAVDLARSALEIYEQMESPHAEIVRKTLAGWKS